MMHGGFSPYFNNTGTWLGLMGPLFNILLVVGVVVLVVWAVKKVGQSNSHQPASGASHPPAGQPLSAREILDIRYARGELSREEYQIIRQDIFEEAT